MITYLTDYVFKDGKYPVASNRNASKVMHFGKVYFDPLRVSLGPCGCIYDNKTIKLSYHVHD